MNPYVIFTDSACDIPVSMLESWGVKHCALTFTFQDDERQYSDNDMPSEAFYAKMRQGGIAKTSAVNVSEFRSLFEEELKLGNDILYIGFSSGLSATCNSGAIAAQELQALYPERKIIAVDSLGASAGFGLLLYLAVMEKEKGSDIHEVAQFVLDHRLHICHWFTVDDLVYLKRGGRVSPTTAVVGNLLGIKPVLHVDDEGHLINMLKVRGRKNAIRMLADKYTELVSDKSAPVFISHGDCMEDAQLLADILREQHGVEVKLITNVGSVIGAHSGPGTLALFFVTDKKR